jgi:hypothetical protein
MGGIAATLFVISPAWSTPIQPNVRKMAQQQRAADYPAARAGWDGPELKTKAQQAPNLTLEMFGPAAVARAVRASLVSAALPDWRVIGCVLLVILLLRRMHRRQKLASSIKPVSEPAAEPPIDEAELPRAA